jgi:hypothetical protein
VDHSAALAAVRGLEEPAVRVRARVPVRRAVAADLLLGQEVQQPVWAARLPEERAVPAVPADSVLEAAPEADLLLSRRSFSAATARTTP